MNFQIIQRHLFRLNPHQERAKHTGNSEVHGKYVLSNTSWILIIFIMISYGFGNYSNYKNSKAIRVSDKIEYTIPFTFLMRGQLVNVRLFCSRLKHWSL